MKILNRHQITLTDEFTVINEPISSDKLMERAAKACVDELVKRSKLNDSFLIVCGPGNNGGDGFAIAWMLLELGYTVNVYQASQDLIASNQHIHKLKFIALNGSIVADLNSPELFTSSIIIDALFGNGLSRPLDENYLDLVKLINTSGKFIIAIDSPSGFYCDTPMPEGAISVRANLTLTFHAPKLMFLFSESAQYIGEWLVLDIGLIETKNSDFNEIDFPFYYTLSNDLIQFIKPRPIHSHKGNYGHALIAGGSLGKMGAAVLAAKACVYSGAGKTTAYVPSSAVSIIQTAVPEAMAIFSDDADCLGGILNPELATAICFGPGVGTSDRTANVLKLIIQQTNVPLVIDADGLNILAENPTWLSFLPPNSILTPHPGEMDRLVGKCSSTFERLQNARGFAVKFGIVIVLKGAYSAIISPLGDVYFNSTGNPGMAKGGSGDVLSGMITSFLAQGFSTINASRLAVFLHGLAGDIAAENYSEIAMTPTNLIESIGKAYLSLTVES